MAISCRFASRTAAKLASGDWIFGSSIATSPVRKIGLKLPRRAALAFALTYTALCAALTSAVDARLGHKS